MVLINTPSAPPLLGRGFFERMVDHLRDLPGYDVVSNIGGQIVSALSLGTITPDMISIGINTQADLADLYTVFTNETGIPANKATKEQMSDWLNNKIKSAGGVQDYSKAILIGAGVLAVAMLGGGAMLSRRRRK